LGSYRLHSLQPLTIRRHHAPGQRRGRGRWQIEGGKVFQGKTRRHVANYSSVKRVSCGTQEQNTAQLWLTLFFLKGRPPENMTLHGAHDFNWLGPW